MIKVGEIYPTSKCGDLKILDYKNCSEITGLFKNTDTVVSGLFSGNVQSGQVLDPFARNVCGLGYLGVGQYRGTNHAKLLNLWSNILNRVYKPKNPVTAKVYGSCSVTEEWYNFQNFAEWYYNKLSNLAPGFDYDVDKDLKINGNKVYGPNQCLLIPSVLNVNISHLNKTNSIAGGVCKYGHTGKFIARIRKSPSEVISKVFERPEQARSFYLLQKAKYILELSYKLYDEKKIDFETLQCVRNKFECEPEEFENG